MEDKSFQDIFKELRIEKSLSQEQIAIELDVSPALISKWENNKSTPAPEMLEYIADYFKVSTDYLIGRTNDRLFNLKDVPLIEQYKILFDKDNKLTDEQKKFFIEFLEMKHKEFDMMNEE